MSPLRFWCYILGERPSQKFPVKINAEEEVYALKEAIKGMLSITFQHVAARNIQLWAISVPFEALPKLSPELSQIPQEREPLDSGLKISAAFPDVQAGHIQILINRLPSPPRIISLNYYILGDEPNNISTLSIAATHNVNQLKEVIAATQRFKDTEPTDLTLWSTLMPEGRTLHQRAKNFIVGKEPLSPLRPLSEIFPDPPALDRVNIIVRLPPPKAGSTTDLYPVPKPLVPSSLAQPPKFNTFQREQHRYAYCRPPELDLEATIPLTLLDPVFATFIEQSETVVLTTEDNAAASYLRTEMLRFYQDEKERAYALRRELRAYGIELSPGTPPGSDRFTDGHMESKGRPVVILKVKNELGSGSVDPLIQTLGHYDLFINGNNLWEDRRSHHPCFVMIFAGPHVAIGGCALGTHPTLELLSSLRLDFHKSNIKARDALARNLSALKKGVISLNIRYSALKDAGLPRANPDPSSLDHPSPIFPYQTSFKSLLPSNQGEQVDFLYIKGTENRLIFTAETVQEKSWIWIKFVQRYGDEVHQWCSDQGFAPKLLGFERLPGGWFMVVMDHLDSSWVRLFDRQTDQEDLKKPVHDAIGQLHKHGMVHGDIRDTNIMVKLSGGSEFKLVDFDWAGRIGEVCYPTFVNKSPSLGRPTEVEDGTPILPSHDNHMLKHIFS